MPFYKNISYLRYFKRINELVFFWLNICYTVFTFHFFWQYFFTSFLSRDEALKLIDDGLLQHGNGSKLITDQQVLHLFYCLFIRNIWHVTNDIMNSWLTSILLIEFYVSRDINSFKILLSSSAICFVVFVLLIFSWMKIL